MPTPIQSKYPNPAFNITDIGGSVGGPIPLLKKTWFFAAYERDWTITPVSLQSTTLPHPSLWGGDFSLVDPQSQPAVSDFAAWPTYTAGTGDQYSFGLQRRRPNGLHTAVYSDPDSFA